MQEYIKLLAMGNPFSLRDVESVSGDLINHNIKKEQ